MKKKEVILSQPFSHTNNEPFARRTISRKVREESAKIAFLRDHPDHPNNGDENDYGNRNYVGNYSKGLPHFDCNDRNDIVNKIGEVKPIAYRRMLRALASGQPYFFGRIPIGGTRRVVNPQSGLAFDLEGADSHALFVPPAPRLDNQEAAGEMVELYWMALLRDVNFEDFSTNEHVRAAAEELSKLPDFKGPKEIVNGQLRITQNTIFRGFTRGDRKGPYVSQFLLLGTESDQRPPRHNTDPALNPLTLRYITYGSIRIDQKQRTVLPGDFLKNFEDWLRGEQGINPIRPDDQACGNDYDNTRRYIRNMRDLANYVHFDDLPQAFWNAALILQHLERPCEPMPRGPVDVGNPYVDSRNQDGFATLGDPNILSLIGEVTTRALKATWFQKWFVHRRLRPEEFGALVHKQFSGISINSDCRVNANSFDYPFDREILNPNTSVLYRIFNNPPNSPSGSYLLPQAYPEGSPLHPSYPAGHAVVAGACVTILKAYFDESTVIPNPVKPNSDGVALEHYDGHLTVGDELDKLASNISLGRNMAGIHYRSDYEAGLNLGEEVAIRLLEEQKNNIYNENFYLNIRRFDGTAITM
ncbi:MAG TPA: vanadium-dependent haloperoxidase [Nitrososphaeraceae archaeon]|nr:vanadium-dependent haloperoxidase [Nitrososphaeraceae archaeon]